MSLGGYQDKLCVAMPRLESEDARVGADGVLVPRGGAPSTHILKPEPRRTRVPTSPRRGR